MPPPHIQSNISTSSQHQSGQHIASVAPNLNDLPKQIKLLAKDVIMNIQSALTIEEEEVESKKMSLKAFESIERLVSSAELQQKANLDATKINQQRGRDVGDGGLGVILSVNTPEQSTSALVSKHLSTIIDTSIFNFFSDSMDQGSSKKCQLLVSFLYALRAILDPICIVRQWWDVLLRPILKDPNCNVRICTKAQLLVTSVMTSTPLTAYEDEAFPTAVWPRPEQSAMAAAATIATVTATPIPNQKGRKPGDAPYPVSSTARSASTTRSSDDADARSLALYSTPSKKSSMQDSMRRFTQRIFDLYTSEAASASSKIVEDYEMQGIGEENGDSEGESTGEGGLFPQKKLQYDAAKLQDNVGSTWKGNLEAIILTFGEERPKAFFHHLSESFIEPHARIPILLLLTIFLRLSTLHVYHVTSTPFVRLLVLSLQLDTSKISTSLGVLAVVSLIPHFPNWLANGGAGGLPAMLSIFARIIDWRRVLPGWEERVNGGTLSEESNQKEELLIEEDEWSHLQHLSKRLRLRKGLNWNRLESNYDTAKTSRPDAMKLFTILYGIFPCNMIRFLRAPIDYLRKAEYQSPFASDWEDIIDEDIVQSKSAAVLHRHRLHPALVDMTAEGEISDTQRWQEHDSASTAAYCTSLFLQEEEVSSQAPMGYQSYQSANIPTTTSINDEQVMITPTADGDHLGYYSGVLSSAAPNSRRRSQSDSTGHHYTSTNDVNISSRLLLQSIRRRSPSVPLNEETITRQMQSLALDLPRLPSSRLIFHNDVSRRVTPDIHLRTHVALRSALPSNTVRATSTSTNERSVSMQSSPSNSSNYQVKSFQPAQSTLTSTVISPPRSSGLAFGSNAVTSIPSTPAMDQEDIILSSPLGSDDRIILGSPALSLGNDVLNTTAVAINANEAAKRARRGKLSYLKQENMQLRNELNYELGQKDQLLRHIGTIHRNRVRDTVREEELQNLYQSRRSDAIQKRNLRDELESIKMEQRQGKIRHANWQAELNSKAKIMREEKKAWANELRQIKKEKEDKDELNAKLEKQLEQNAGELFELKEKTRANSEKVAAIQRYEDKISQMEIALKYWNHDMHKFERQNKELQAVLSRWQEMNMLIEASEEQAEKLRRERVEMERKNELLEKQLKEANEIIDKINLQREGNESEKSRFGSSSSASTLMTAREEANRLQKKKKLEELESLLLDSKVREEYYKNMIERAQLQVSQSSSTLISPSMVSNVENGHDLSPEHAIAPLDL